MDKASGGSGKPAAAQFGFGFSWADEVEREEREQEHMAADQQGREAKKEKQTRADPFGAARPREVVLAEKGVDWRDRDRELDAATRRHRHAAATAARVPMAEAAAKNRARTVPARACARRSTPARRAPRDRRSGWTPGRRRRDAESTPRAKDAPPVSLSAWGGGKRKWAGEVRAPATAQRVRVVGEQERRIFGELNVDDGCGPSFRSATKKSCNSGGSKTEGREAAVVVAEGSRNRGCSATATAIGDQSAVGKKRKGRKKGRGGGSNKTEDQQTLLV
jgi:hypothetical protein